MTIFHPQLLPPTHTRPTCFRSSLASAQLSGMSNDILSTNPPSSLVMRLPLFFLMLVFTRSFPLRAFASRVPSSSGSSSCLSSTAAPTNPLLQQDSLPKFASIEPHHLTPAIDTLLSTLTTSFAAFEAAIPASPTYDDLLPALERLRAPPSYAWGVAGHLNGVANGDALRAAYEKSQPTVIETFTKLSQSRKLFDAMVDVFENEKGLSNAQMRALEGSIKAMKLGGVGLDGAEKVSPPFAWVFRFSDEIESAAEWLETRDRAVQNVVAGGPICATSGSKRPRAIQNALRAARNALFAFK